MRSVCPGEREQDECGGVRRVGECGQGRSRAGIGGMEARGRKPEGYCELLVEERQVEIDGEQIVDERRVLAEDSDHVASRMAAE